MNSVYGTSRSAVLRFPPARFAVTIRQSSSETWVNCGPPFTSPSAQTPAAVVSSRSFTLMKPRSSVSTPAAGRFSSSVFGTRPRAASRSEPSTARSPDGVWSRTRTDWPDSPSTRSHRRPEEHVDPVLPEDLKHLLRDVRVFPRQERLGPFDDRHPAAEPAEHLRELAADVAAAEDDEVLGQAVQLLDRLAVKRPRVGEPGHRRQGRAGSGVEEHLVGGQLPHPAVLGAGLRASAAR